MSAARPATKGGASASPDFASFMAKLLAPLPAGDRFDRRTSIEDADAFVMDWLRLHHPRFRQGDQ